MNTRTLLSKLMSTYGDNPNSLAVKLESQKVKQPQLHKFVTGKTVEPKRSTLKPVADFYKVPVDAFFNDELALELLAKLEAGWLPKPQWRTLNNSTAATATHSVQEPAPTQTQSQTQSSSRPSDIEAAFEVLASHLQHADATSRKQAAFQLASLADSPQDHAKLAALFAVATAPTKRLRA